LRKDKGGEILDRDAVATGKQLAKDILLKYKDLVHLGVLSKQDERILNDIIPSDPLSFNFIPGQDPTMTKMSNFHKSLNADFNTNLKARIKNPINAQTNTTNTSNSETSTEDSVKVQAPDGRVKIIPKSDLSRAIAAGGKLIP
jgi:hypothetical protein